MLKLKTTGVTWDWGDPEKSERILSHKPHILVNILFCTLWYAFLVGAFLVKRARLLQWLVFLVGAFSFKEKSPTITVASFFFLFFRQTTELIAYVPLFTETDKFTQASSTNANLLQRVPPFVFHLFYVTYKTGRLQRVPPFNFFRHCANFFFENF